MKEKYLNLSPYNYCANNPVKYVDPDGKWFWEKSNVRQARKYAKATGGTFNKWTGEDGKRYASVTANYSANVDDDIGTFGKEVVVEAYVFRPGEDRYYLLRNAGVPIYEAKRASAKGFLGRIKALLETGDAWGQGRGEYDRNGQAPGIVKGIAGLNPLVSVPNSLKILIKEEDIYEVEASSGTDKTFAIVGIIQPLNPAKNISEKVFNKETVGMIINWTIQGVLFSNDSGLLEDLKNQKSDIENENKLRE
jgi:hypothetical protein